MFTSDVDPAAAGRRVLQHDMLDEVPSRRASSPPVIRHDLLIASHYTLNAEAYHPST